MGKLSQLSIAITLLGGVVTLIGLFPTVTGLEPTPGIGILQILTILFGFSVLIGGALLFIQSTYYPGIRHNLAQQIALRLSMTGLVIAAVSGLADVLGYGSHPPGPHQRPFLGVFQATGLIAGFFIASLGVILFALTGKSSPPSDDDKLDKS
jgi:hypothetical protein